MKGKKLAALTAVLYILFLAACSASWLAQMPFQELISKITKTVVFEAGVVKRDSAELALVLAEGETAKLSELGTLRSLDLRGSACIDEIRLWAEENPEVSVLYELELPNGLTVENQATELDFTGINSSNLQQFSDLLVHFPRAAIVELGNAADSPAPLSSGELYSLSSAHPELEFNYSFTLGGEAVSLLDESVDLSRLESAQLDETTGFLACMNKLTTIGLGDENSCKLSWDEIVRLQEACPQARIEYSFSLYGRSFSLADEAIDLSNVPVDDKGEAVKAALRCMKNCKTLDMDSCGLTNDEMLAIRKEFPEVDVIWRVWFGEYLYYSVRTDTKRILASKASDAGQVTNADVKALSCCNKIKYLDLGHNINLTDISFVSSMPELEVLIVATNSYLMDISPLADCPKLEYLEIFSTSVIDLSPLAEAKELRHLNIYNCPYLTDISPLFNLSELERVWIGNITPVSVEQLEQLHAAAPNCYICTAPGEPTENDWRYTSYDINYHTFDWVPRYLRLMAQIGYNYQQYSFYWLDPKCTLPAPPHLAGAYAQPPAEADADNYDPEMPDEELMSIFA